MRHKQSELRGLQPIVTEGSKILARTVGVDKTTISKTNSNKPSNRWVLDRLASHRWNDLRHHNFRDTKQRSYARMDPTGILRGRGFEYN